MHMFVMLFLKELWQCFWLSNHRFPENKFWQDNFLFFLPVLLLTAWFGLQKKRMRFWVALIGTRGEGVLCLPRDSVPDAVFTYECAYHRQSWQSGRLSFKSEQKSEVVRNHLLWETVEASQIIHLGDVFTWQKRVKYLQTFKRLPCELAGVLSGWALIYKPRGPGGHSWIPH